MHVTFDAFRTWCQFIGCVFVNCVTFCVCYPWYSLHSRFTRQMRALMWVQCSHRLWPVLTAEHWWRWSGGGWAVKHRNSVEATSVTLVSEHSMRSGPEGNKGEKPFYSTMPRCLYTTQKLFSWIVTGFWQNYQGPMTTALNIYFNPTCFVQCQKPLSWKGEP